MHRLFSFDEIKEATNDFDRTNLMGAGLIGKVLALLQLILCLCFIQS